MGDVVSQKENGIAFYGDHAREVVSVICDLGRAATAFLIARSQEISTSMSNKANEDEKLKKIKAANALMRAQIEEEENKAKLARSMKERLRAEQSWKDSQNRPPKPPSKTHQKPRQQPTAEVNGGALTHKPFAALKTAQAVQEVQEPQVEASPS
jgi:monoamine oxidase